MAELPWLAAGPYVPLLFYGSQDGFSGLCTQKSGLPPALLWRRTAVGTKATSVLDAENADWSPPTPVRGRFPPIKIVATSSLVDVGEKGLAEERTVSGKTLQPNELAGVLRELIDARQV
jgi:hypothetical protein